MRRTARLCWLWAGGLLLLYSVPSILFLGFANMGSFAIAALGAAAVCTPFLWKKLHGRGRTALSAIWAVSLLLMTLLTAVMLYTAYIAVPSAENPPGTVIILGAKLLDDEPSLILTRRLEKALFYLTEHPDSAVVVSGGLGEGENHTEAAVMRLWLEQNGIASRRIYEEDASAVTSENFAFSAKIIHENGLDTRIVICTDGFHQLRSALFAQGNGLTPSALSSSTPPRLIPMYYVREWFGLVKALLLQK